jgi:hypothetical protein
MTLRLALIFILIAVAITLVLGGCCVPTPNHYDDMRAMPH